MTKLVRLGIGDQDIMPVAAIIVRVLKQDLDRAWADREPHTY